MKGCKPDAPTTKTLDQIQTVLKGVFPVEVSLASVEVVTFTQRVQRVDEAFKEYVSAITEIANKCGFGQSLGARLRERLTTGTTNSELQKKMLSEPALTFEQACTAGTQLEAVELQTQFLKDQRNPEKVYTVSNTKRYSNVSISRSSGGQEYKPNLCDCYRSKQKPFTST